MRSETCRRVSLAVALIFLALLWACGGGAAEEPSAPAQVAPEYPPAQEYGEAMEEAGEALDETAEAASEAAEVAAQGVGTAVEEIPMETEKFAEELDIMLRTTSPEDVMMRLAEALEEFAEEVEGGRMDGEDHRVIVTSLDAMYDAAGQLREEYLTDADPAALEQLDDLMKEIYTLQEELLQSQQN